MKYTDCEYTYQRVSQFSTIRYLTWGWRGPDEAYTTTTEAQQAGADLTVTRHRLCTLAEGRVISGWGGGVKTV